MSEPFSLNWLDLAIVIVIVGSMTISLWRGFGREVLSLVNFFVAFVIARLFSPHLAGVLVETVQQPVLRNLVAYGLLFFLSLLVGGLVMRAVAMLIKFGGLQTADRLLGTVFGFARGLIIVVVAIGAINWGGWMEYTDVWQNSALVSKVLPVEQWSRELVRLWLFERDMDGLADTLMWQLDALQNSKQAQGAPSNQVLQMLGPR